MQRYALKHLINWKNKKNHKPLVIQGARQVGKTWLMQEFGKKYYEQVAYINFDVDVKSREIFDVDYDTERLIMDIGLATKTKINAENTLIIFDEIQECPRALTSLKYFRENAPQYDIIVAGSLLGVACHEGTGFPVGKVSFMNLFPLSFEEFLLAMGEGRFVELLNKKDIYLKVLKIKGRSMIYVYQKEKLNKLCACKQIQNIFKKYNYNCTSLDTLILDLQKRLNDYDFPHEIGLFLGYPMTDVLGFIEGKEYLSVGYWKVYSHVKNCQHTFDKYHKCTHELCKRFNQGESVEQICRYV